MILIGYNNEYIIIMILIGYNMYEKFTSPLWRLENLYYIVDKNGNQIKYKPNNIQKTIIQNKQNRKIILKARQFGVSTHCIIEMLDYVLWNKNVNACIIAHERDAIEKLFRIARRAYELLHPDLKPELDRGGGSKYKFYFPSMNSQIYCDLESRGDTINKLHISEAAFIKDPNMINATLQAVPLNGHVTMETTPNGMGNHFYKTWKDNNSAYGKLFFPWYIFDEYSIITKSLEYTRNETDLIAFAKKKFGININKSQIAFRRLKQNELKDIFLQEYPENDDNCFITTGNSALNLNIVKSIKDDKRNSSKIVNGIQIFKELEKGSYYICGADPAEGVGGDSSVAVMLECETREEVALLKGNYEPFAFAHKLKELCNLYKYQHEYPLLVVEQNNHGHAVLLELIRHIKYPNIYYRNENQPGFRTDMVTRPITLDTFIDAIHNSNIKIHSEEIINECFTLINNRGKVEAAMGEHDDCVMACAIALKILIEEYSKLLLYKNIEKKILI